jgi:tight adherence protein B
VRRIALALAAFALAAPASAAAASAGRVEFRQPDFHAYPEVSVTVVTSRPSSSPPSLRENGKPAVGLRAQNLGRAKSVVLAIDRSQSMRGQALRDAANGARAFVARKPAGDRIAVVAVGKRALSLTRFSSATIDVDIALRTIDVDTRYGTALYDAVVLSAQSLSGEGLPGRILILLTDGQEVSSKASLSEAIDAARSAGVAVYPIGIESPKFRPAPLKELAAQTGGTYYGAATSAALKGVYTAIAAELTRTWQLRYVTAARPGDRLRLETRLPDVGAGRVDTAVPGKAESSGSSSRLPQGTDGEAGSFVVSLAVGLLVLGGLLMIARVGRESTLRKRLAPHVEQRRERNAPRERFASGAALLRATEATFAHLKIWHTTHRLLERADLPLRTVEFLYIAAGSGLGTALLALVATGSFLIAFVALLIGASVPFAYLLVRARRRLAAFDEQLPDLLLTIAASLKAGHSFKQGLQAVTDEDQPPASKEIKRVLREAQLGRPLEDALTEMAERFGSRNLEFVITSITIQSQVGGSLAGLFDMVADAVRQRQQFARKIRALTAMGRASAYVLLALPFGMGGVLFAINGEYMEPLYATSTGRMMIIASLTMMAMGALMIRKIVSFRG